MNGFLKKCNKDHLGGGLMFLLGLGAAWEGISYKVGMLSAMGPGFFPTALGAILMLVGIVILAGSRKTKAGSAAGQAEFIWRGPLCIALGLAAFLLLGHYGGLVPATFAVVFISALGDRQNSIRQAALLASALVVVCVVVFWWALAMLFSLFQWG